MKTELERRANEQPEQLAADSANHLGEVAEHEPTELILQMFQYSIDQASDAIFWMTRDGGFSYVNEQACRSLGYAREELLLLHLWDIDPLISKESWDSLTEQMPPNGQSKDEHFESLQRRKDGSVFPVDVSVQHLWFGDQKLLVTVVRDITERKRADDALRESEYVLQSSQSVARIGSYYLDLGTGKWLGSLILDELFGIDDHSPKDVEGWLSLIHPEQRSEMHDYLSQHVLAEHNRFDKEYRIVRHDNQQVRWVHGLGELEFDAQGSPIRMIGTIQDITVRKELERDLLLTQFAVDHASVGIMRTGPQAQILSVNQQCCQFLGYTSQELCTMHVYDIDPNFPLDRWTQHRSRIRESGSDTFETVHRRKDGSTFPVEISVTYTSYQGEEFAISFIRDITERKAVEGALRASEERLQQAVRVGSIGFFDHDHRNNALYWSPEHRSIYGYGMSEPVPVETGRNHVYSEDLERVDEAVQRAWAPTGDGTFDIEYRIIDRSSAIRWISTRSRTLFEGEGDARHPVRTIGAVLDITERKATEQNLQTKLKEEHELQIYLIALHDITIELTQVDQLDTFYRRAIELGLERLGFERLGLLLYDTEHLLALGTYGTDVNGNVIDERHVRFTPDEKGLMWRAFQHSERFAFDEAVPLYTGTIPTGKGWNAAAVLWNGSASLGWLAADNGLQHKPVSKPQLDALSLYALTLGSLLVQKQEQAARRAGELRYRSIVETAQEGIWLVDNAAVTTYVNPTMAAMFGYAPDEMLGRTLFDFMDASDLAEVARLFGQRQIGVSEQYEFRFKRKDGSYVWAALATNAIMDDEGQSVAALAMVTDITERRCQEEALRLSASRLSDAQTIAHIGNWDWDLVTNDLYWSDETYRIFGMQPQESKFGMLTFLEKIHPDDANRQQEAVNAAIQGAAYAIDHRIVRSDGEIRHVQQNGQLIYDQQGMPIRMIGTTQDITERKQAEDLIRVSLHEKEILLREIHHRVKNNLQIISSLLNLQSGSIADSRTLAQFQDSQNRVRSMALIHERLYQSESLAFIDFGTYLRDLVASLVQTYRTQAQGVSLQVEADTAMLDIDTAIPCGLILNELVSNALKHAFPDGRVGEIGVALRAEGETGRYVLAVWDDGVGFPAGVDFRNTPSLGLQLINSLARQLYGTVTLNQEAGTRFEICFTASSQKEKADPYD